jgi:hypothetical protein
MIGILLAHVLVHDVFVHSLTYILLHDVWYGMSLMHGQVQGSSYGSILFILQRR